MQRVNSGVFHNILPSAQKPPRAPAKSRSSQMDPGGYRDGGFGKDLEKGERRRWKPRADHAVHLVPVVLLVCMFVLYIFSSVPVEDNGVVLAGSVTTGAQHRRLLATDSAEEEGTKSSSNVRTEVQVTKYDLHRFPFRLRGGKPHF